MEKKRLFSRITCDEKIIVLFNKETVEARLLEVSLKGALMEFKEEPLMLVGERCRITLTLKDSDVVLQFRAEVVHGSKNRVGVKFKFMDIDTFIHLRSFLEARTADPQLICEEMGHLIVACQPEQQGNDGCHD